MTCMESAKEVGEDTDVIVIGAGPAGMSAAVELSESGLGVVVLDMQPSPGGQIFRALEENTRALPTTGPLLDALGPAYRAGMGLIKSFRAATGIDFRPGTTVWDLRPDGTVGWMKDDKAGYLRARHVLIATGAMERPVPFPGWTLPGVMTAGAVQTLIKAGRLQPDGRVVLAGTGPLVFLLAEQLRRLGVRPACIARTDRIRDQFKAVRHLRPGAVPALLKGLGWMTRLRLAGIPMRRGVSGLEALGDERVEAVRMTVGGESVDLPCDFLVVHDGIVPSIDLAHGAGLALEWRREEASWRPMTAPDGKARIVAGALPDAGTCQIHVSGDARRIGGAEAAIAHGRYAAKAIVADLRKQGAVRKPAAVPRTLSARPFLEAAFPQGLSADLPDDGTIVCRCEEITAGAIRASIRQGAHDMNQIRGLLRCGMGPCQGRNCTVTMARLLAEGTHTPVAPVPFRARPPIRPIPLGALAGLTGMDPDLARSIAWSDVWSEAKDAETEGDVDA